MFNGKTRKLVLTAARNGYFFVLDRVTGEHLVTSKYGMLTNWANGLNKFGGSEARSGERRHRRRLAGIARLPTAPSTGSRPAYSPHTGLFYVAETTPIPSSISPISIRAAPWGWAARKKRRSDRRQLSDGDRLQDRQSRVAPSLLRQRRRRRRLLVTAGGLLFAGDGSGSLVAHDAATGESSGTRASGMLRMHRRLTCWMGISMLSARPAIGSGRSCFTIRLEDP